MTKPATDLINDLGLNTGTIQETSQSQQQAQMYNYMWTDIPNITPPERPKKIPPPGGGRGSIFDWPLGSGRPSEDNYNRRGKRPPFLFDVNPNELLGFYKSNTGVWVGAREVRYHLRYQRKSSKRQRDDGFMSDMFAGFF